MYCHLRRILESCRQWYMVGSREEYSSSIKSFTSSVPILTMVSHIFLYINRWQSNQEGRLGIWVWFGCDLGVIWVLCRSCELFWWCCCNLNFRANVVTENLRKLKEKGHHKILRKPEKSRPRKHDNTDQSVSSMSRETFKGSEKLSHLSFCSMMMIRLNHHCKIEAFGKIEKESKSKWKWKYAKVEKMKV